MQDAIRRFDPTTETLTEEGCYINELSNSTDDPGCSIARARVPESVATCWHRLAETTERYVILEGQGRVELGGRHPQSVAVGDVVLIPPGMRQRIVNTGSVDLIFLAICTPRFVWSAYERISAVA